MTIAEILYNFRKKQLIQQDISHLLAAMHQHQLNTIPIWRISGLTRLTTATARLQGYLVIFAGLLFIPAAIYEKYHEDNSKIYRIAVYTPIATAFVLAPILLYRRTIKHILNSIDYNLSQNCLQLQTFKNESLQVPIKDIRVRYNPLKPKIVHDLTVLSEGK